MKPKNIKVDVAKANKKASREMNLGNGFVSTHKVFKSKKLYNRKNKKR